MLRIGLIVFFSWLVLFELPLAPLSASPASERPLVFALQKQKNPADINVSANAMAEALEKRLGRKVEVLVPSDYSATVQALVSRKADIGYLSSLPFLLAQRDGNAVMLLAEARPDARGQLQTRYDSVLVARRDSGIDDWESITSNAGQLRLVYTSHTSTSGYVFPFAYFRSQGLLKPDQRAEDVFRRVQYAGGYAQALQQLVAGNADIAAVSAYTMEGKSANLYLPEESREGLKIIHRIAGVPTHLIAARDGLSEKEREQIAEALLEISHKSPALLADVYGAAALVRVDPHAHVHATKEAILRSDLPIQGLVP